MIKNIEELKPTNLYKYFWKFAYYRQEVFLQRLKNPYAKSTDPIIAEYKFTNTYRVLDRTSQYLVREIINKEDNYSDEDLLFRILVFKIFNKIETWEALEELLGDIKWSTFNLKEYKKAFKHITMSGKKVYSAAYIMPSGVTSYSSKIKYENHLALLVDIMKDNATSKIKNFNSLKSLYNYLISFPTIGKFLGYQYAIDINYSHLTNFDENEFVVAGPGALRGIKKAFKNTYIEPEKVIKYLTTNQAFLSKQSGYPFNGLKGRALKLIDVQNLFCEFDKYTRQINKEPKSEITTKRTRIKQKFKANTNKIEYEFPKKWDLKTPLVV